MNQSFPFPPISQDEERRRALAKIYALLVKLADKAEKSASSSEVNVSAEETKEKFSVPLKSNIPPTEV